MGVGASKQVAETVISACQQAEGTGRIDTILLTDDNVRSNSILRT